MPDATSNHNFFNDAIPASVKMPFTNILVQMSVLLVWCVYTPNVNEKLPAGSRSGGFYGKHHTIFWNVGVKKQKIQMMIELF